VDIDSSTWQALGLTLTGIGLLLSVLAWRRRGPASGLRGVAWSLLPAAAGLTGTLRLLWDIGDSVASWAARLVFSSRKAEPAVQDKDMDDIEAILRKHGIQ
jgi:hypothetical protein